MKVAPKATLLLVVLAVAPVIGLVALFLPRYGEAVRETEQRRQLELAQAIGALALHHVDRAVDDAAAVAAATAHVAEAEEKDVEAALAAQRAVLVTRPSIDLARVEIPSRDVSMVIAKEGAHKDAAPTSTAAMRAEADAKGSALEIVDQRTARLVVPVRAPKAAAQAYVTVPVYLQPLHDDLADLIAARGLERETNVAVMDRAHRVLTAAGDWGLGVGADGSNLPIVRRVGDLDPSARLGIQEDVREGDRDLACSLVIVGRPDAPSGWLVVVARPHAVAYARLEQIRGALVGVSAATVLGALVAAFLAARGVVKPVAALRRRAQKLGSRAWAEIGEPSTRKDEIGDLDRALVQAGRDIASTEEKLAIEEKRRADLSRFMAPEVVDAIVAGTHEVELGGRRRLVTVLFADVVAFTPLAEKRDPEEVVKLLNDVFSVLTEVIFRHRGVVDKFVGDSVMAMWGAPIEEPDHASNALRAAEDMMRFLETASEELRRVYEVDLRVAIAVNSGEVIVGNIGSTRRMEYTAIGDAVNVAARLEAIARPDQVLVGERTRELVGEEFRFRDLGSRRLAGRAAEVRVFELEVG